MNIGEIYSQFRKERGLTLKQATGNQFSTSMLSRFENGQSDISAEKLFLALDHIYLDPEEFLYLVRNFRLSDFQKFKNSLIRLRDAGDKEGLEKLKRIEEEKSKIDGKIQYHRLNQAIISLILTKDFGHEFSDSDLVKVEDYLFKTGIWGQYELFLFVQSVDFFKSELLVTYCRELLHKMDYLDDYPGNKITIHSILLNAMFTSIEREKYVDARYFEKQISRYFDNDRDLYMRLLFRIAQKLLDLCQEGTENLSDLNRLLDMFQEIGNEAEARYYRTEIQKIVDNCK